MNKILALLAAMIFTSSVFASSYVARDVLENALRNAASTYAYEDEELSCGGKLLSYKVLRDSKEEIMVQAIVSAGVGYCSKTIRLTCFGYFNPTADGKELLYKDFFCTEPEL